MKRVYDFENGVDIIGLMSGTSLDGLDICLVRFFFKDGKWSYKTLYAEDEQYPADLKARLSRAQMMNAEEYALLHSDYGLYLGERVKAFMERHSVRDVAAIASHGQTVFHQPHLRFTGQIGSGAGIAAVSGVDTICDFRTTDVALGGQGAPLVPVGDRNLFGEYDYCLNIGGFSNISSEGVKDGRQVRVAHDISPVNYVLNHYTRTIGLDYDRDGEIARSGSIHRDLLKKLNSLPFYSMEGPKSLGREWVENEVIPLIEAARKEDGNPLTLADKLATFTEHAAYQISLNVVQKGAEKAKVLTTGGGAYNKYLLERMLFNAPHAQFVVPDDITVKFKEALIFAFLGALYLADMPNCMSSVTGAEYDCIGGALYKAGR
ncbi:MAG: anhydro-N-acetylmuramic acid kinase [Bacteroidales bacterium]|jgi:anhydro-N-acetylmuramic acid kinase|nr:anhydro-N-acetylmuramic acid kinase [Bacteroidales bacterium]